MRNNWKIALIPLLLAGCAGMPSNAKQAELVGEARATAGDFIKTLGGALKAAMAAGGPENAIGVCKEMAPALAQEASVQSGMSVKRVSTKNRNPKGVPDAWEAAAIARFEQQLAAGAKAETLDTYAVVDDGKTFRYAKALVTQDICLQCHGMSEAMKEGVQARLAAEYPNDKAVGYAAGTVRGIITLRKPL